MKELLQHFADYNVWANQRLAEITRIVPESTLMQKVVGSFPSVKSTIMHMMDAENIWWQRMLLVEKIERPSDRFQGSAVDALDMLATQNMAWKSWVERAGITELTRSFTYKSFRNEEFTQPVSDLLLHLFNHGTYHRGQWVNQLRELGVETLPATDYIVFSR